MASFKERPEDFEVTEVMDFEKQKKGGYSYFLLTKREWGSFEAFKEIAKRAKIKPNLIGYGGLKDKHAVTHQYISVPEAFGKRLHDARIKDITLEWVGNNDERIILGALKGNKFHIIVRDVDEKKELNVDRVKNYFDTQRFGSKALVTGRALIQHDFERVCKLMGLKIKDNDPIKALRRIERRVMRFYTSSYQSWMWNNVVEQLSDEVEKVPILGYLTEFNNKNVERLYKKLMKEEKINLDNFLLKPFPELSSEGSERNVYFNVDDFSYQWEWDELHGGKYKCVLNFFLSKGCYATLVVKQLFPGVKDKSIS